MFRGFVFPGSAPRDGARSWTTARPCLPLLWSNLSSPLILVTNDDGVHATGIKALAAGLAPLGEVHVVAPDREVSACAQSLTLKHPLRAERVDERTFAVDGT